jgi:hypothetical protein
MPTWGTRLDLRAQGVEAPLEMVPLTVRPTLTVRTRTLI